MLQQRDIFEGSGASDAKRGRNSKEKCDSEGAESGNNGSNVSSTIGYVSGGTVNVTISYYGPSHRP